MSGISSSPQTGQSVFSLDTQAGVMNLLASIRASQLSAAEKNELRDLVFLYTNGGHDQSVRISLENKLRDRQVMPVKPKQNTATQAAPKERPTIGNFRSAPTFSVKVSSDEAITQPDAIQAQSSETKVSETTDTVEQKDAEFEDHVPEVVAKATASPAGDAVEESAPAQAPAEEQAAQHGDILERI